MEKMEEEGYWLCDNGHEKGGALSPGPDEESRKCIECNAPAKFVKRSEMTPKEQYESGKERGEAEKVAESKRQAAKAESENIAGGEQTGNHLRGLAENGRSVADKIRAL
jgi:hypothetical protein